jgi:glucokinase
MAELKDDKYWVGFDLGGTKMLAAVFDAGFKPIARERKRTKGHEGVAAGLERISQTIHKALDEAQLTTDDLAGIGVGCPGPLDLDRGIIFDAPNLGWTDVKIKQALEKEFGCPAVIANDVDAGVYGEYRFGAAKGARCVLGVFPGTGIGGGCVYEGRILRGRQSSCMEIGHIQVLPEGPLCGCGQYGCLEAVASRMAVSGAAAQAAFRGQAPYLLSKAGSDLSNIRSSLLAEAIKAGDLVIERILRGAADHIGTAVAGAIHLIAPDVVVLGGGLVEAMPELFVEGVEERARARVLPSFADTFRVVAAKLGDDATATGAAAWVKEVTN